MFFAAQRTPESPSPSIFQPQCLNTASLKRELWGSLPCRGGRWRSEPSQERCGVLQGVPSREGGGIAPSFPTFYKGTSPSVVHNQSLFNFIVICRIIGDQNQTRSPRPAVALLRSSAWGQFNVFLKRGDTPWCFVIHFVIHSALCHRSFGAALVPHLAVGQWEQTRTVKRWHRPACPSCVQDVGSVDECKESFEWRRCLLCLICMAGPKWKSQPKI